MLKLQHKTEGKSRYPNFLSQLVGISTFWAKTFGKNLIVILLSKNGGKVDGL